MSKKTKRLFIQFQDGGGNWAHACTINTTREFTIEGSPNETPDYNCEDPDAPTWILRAIDTLSAGIDGAGTADPPSFGVLRAKMLAGASFPIRVFLDESAADGGGWFQGNYVMTRLGLAKEGKGYVTSSMAFASDGEIAWTAAT